MLHLPGIEVQGFVAARGGLSHNAHVPNFHLAGRVLHRIRPVFIARLKLLFSRD
ncbi:MAG: hypothetical protein WAT78_06440 [Rhizobiaceae bacterium]